MVTAINRNQPQSSAINRNQHTELLKAVAFFVALALVLVLVLVLDLMPVLVIARRHAMVPATALELARHRLAGRGLWLRRAAGRAGRAGRRGRGA